MNHILHCKLDMYVIIITLLLLAAAQGRIVVSSEPRSPYSAATVSPTLKVGLLHVAPPMTRSPGFRAIPRVFRWLAHHVRLANGEPNGD